MTAALQPLSVSAAGFLGLNVQESAVSLDAKWALAADNCVIDRFGRIGSRKGWQPVNTTAITSSPNIKSLAQYIKPNSTTEIISCAGGAIYTGTSTLTSLGSGYIDDNWKIENFNGKLYFFQRGMAPLVYDGTTLVTIAASTGYLGAVPYANECEAAYGRLWVAGTSTDNTVITYSDSLVGNHWTNTDGTVPAGAGSCGVIDLKSVWTEGMDEIVAIKGWNGSLIIFGRNSILVYGSPEQPNNMTLTEHIVGIGCIARDSIQEIGTDLIFLSNTGIRSLGRVIQEKSMPMNDVSRNVRDLTLSYVADEDTNLIKSVYSPIEGFYLITFPTSNAVFCFDVRQVLPDGASRVTIWNNIKPHSLLYTKERNLYIGKEGYIGQYTGYTDNGNSYRLVYNSTWIDFSNPDVIKIPKKLDVTVIGSINSTVVFKWAVDYGGLNNNSTKTIISDTPAQYAVDQYDTAQYSAGIATIVLRTPLTKRGKVIQIGIEADISGNQLSIQKFDIFAKPGREI